MMMKTKLVKRASMIVKLKAARFSKTSYFESGVNDKSEH